MISLGEKNMRKVPDGTTTAVCPDADGRLVILWGARSACRQNADPDGDLCRLILRRSLERTQPNGQCLGHEAQAQGLHYGSLNCARVDVPLAAAANCWDFFFRRWEFRYQ
jgi:hypothetical protein